MNLDFNDELVLFSIDYERLPLTYEKNGLCIRLCPVKACSASSLVGTDFVLGLALLQMGERLIGSFIHGTGCRIVILIHRGRFNPLRVLEQPQMT